MKQLVMAGERRLGKGEGTLSILGLGSCVAVALYDEWSRAGGLAHILLPDPTMSSNHDRTWRFASTAIPELVRELELTGAQRDRLTARVAGGACMFQELLPRDRPNIGERNVEAVRATLSGQGIPIVGEDVGGDYGRSLDFDLGSGRVRVSSHGRGHVEL